MTLVEPAKALVGHIGVPGDKSISHRAVLLGAIGEGETTIAGFGRSADTESTLAAVRALGAEVAEDEVDTRAGGRRRAARAARRRPSRSTAATPARCCGCSRASWPGRRAASS